MPKSAVARKFDVPSFEVDPVPPPLEEDVELTDSALQELMIDEIETHTAEAKSNVIQLRADSVKIGELGVLTLKEQEENADITRTGSRYSREYIAIVDAIIADSAIKMKAIDEERRVKAADKRQEPVLVESDEPMLATSRLPEPTKPTKMVKPAPVLNSARPEISETKPSEASLEALALAARELASLEARFAKGGKKNPELGASLKEAREAYEAKRLEYVGDSVQRQVEAQEQKVEAARETLEKEKGYLPKIFENYKKLGDLNVGLLMEKKLGGAPRSRVGKAIAKALSVRTAIGLGLVVGSGLFGAGSAVGFTMVAARRMLTGMGASIGTYDVLKSAREAKLSAEFSPLEIETMDKEEVVKRMEQIEANALVGGKSLVGHKAYEQLKGRFVEVATVRQNLRELAGESKADQMREELAKSDADLTAEVQKAKRANLKRKGIAAAVGLFVGSGALAKVFGNTTRWLGESVGLVKKTATTAAVEAAVAPNVVQEVSVPVQPDEVRATMLADAHNEYQVTPSGNIEAVGEVKTEAVLDEKMAAASEVVRGDGYARVIQRDLLADPEKFGYDANSGIDAKTWAKATATDVMRKNGLLSAGREMRFSVDPASGDKSRIVLKMENGQITVEKTGIKEYVHLRAAKVVPVEQPAAISPEVVEPKPTGLPVSVESDGISAEGNYEATGSHIEPLALGHVEHRFDPLLPSELRRAKALLPEGYEEHLGKGVQKNPALVERLFKTRMEKLYSLKEAYEQAAFEHKEDLAARLHGEYNTLAQYTNRDISDTEIFKRLPSIGESQDPSSIRYLDDRPDAGSALAEDRPAVKPKAKLRVPKA
jgi:hypothetical protein